MCAKPLLGCQTYSSELPPRCRLKEMSIGRAHMICRCGARPSAQNHLTGHKLAVVFAQRTRKGLVSRIAGVGTGRPFPTVPEELLNTHTARGCGMQPPTVEQVPVRRCLARDAFPFFFRWESATSPACKGIGLEETYVAYGG